MSLIVYGYKEPKDSMENIFNVYRQRLNERDNTEVILFNNMLKTYNNTQSVSELFGDGMRSTCESNFVGMLNALVNKEGISSDSSCVQECILNRVAQEVTSSGLSIECDFRSVLFDSVTRDSLYTIGGKQSIARWEVSISKGVCIIVESRWGNLGYSFSFVVNAKEVGDTNRFKNIVNTAKEIVTSLENYQCYYVFLYLVSKY